MARAKQPVIWTIGHSTRPFEEFAALLAAHDIQVLVDVRTIPKSRRYLQYNSDELAAALSTRGVGYRHLAALGGLRHARKDSINVGWRNLSFRGYADYMATDEFKEGLAALVALSRKERTAIMCAEAVPWRCHRSLIADALLADGWVVKDIMTAASAPLHKPTSFLRITDGELSYPGPTAPLI